MAVASRVKTSKSDGILWVLGDPESILPDFRKILGREYTLTLFKGLGDFQRIARASSQGKGKTPPALLITDVQLPDGDFLRFLECKETSLPPFMVISACNDPTVIRACLNQGAIDYLVKPVDPNLLVTKLQWFIERPKSRLRCQEGGLSMNPVSLIVSSSQGRRAKLTVKEFQILTILKEAYPASVRRDTFRSELWPSVSVVPKTLDTHLFNLRRKLEGLGYEIRYEPDKTYVLAQIGSSD